VGRRRLPSVARARDGDADEPGRNLPRVSGTAGGRGTAALKAREKREGRLAAGGGPWLTRFRWAARRAGFGDAVLGLTADPMAEQTG